MDLLDGLNVLLDGVDIPLFLNSLDIFAEGILVLLSLIITVMRMNASYLLNAPTCPRKLNRRLGRLLSHLLIIFYRDKNLMISYL